MREVTNANVPPCSSKQRCIGGIEAKHCGQESQIRLREFVPKKKGRLCQHSVEPLQPRIHVGCGLIVGTLGRTEPTREGGEENENFLSRSGWDLADVEAEIQAEGQQSKGVLLAG